MANTKITALSGISSMAIDDVLPIVDVSGTPTTKKVTTEKLLSGLKNSSVVVAASDSYSSIGADYICNGTNDHVEIQAAIDALPASGGEVRLLDGTFNIETVISLDSNQTIRGNGKNTILTTTSAIRIIESQGGSGTEHTGITVSDLQIDGNSVAVCGILYLYTDNSLIQNVYVHGMTDTGAIRVQSSDYTTVESCHCISNTTSGILFSSCTYGVISNNIVQGSSIMGIWLSGTSDTVVSGNVSAGNTQHGIQVQTSNNNTISNNTFNDNTKSGVYISGSEYNTINSNSCSGNTERGIFLITTTENVVVGNACQGNGFSNIHLENVASKNVINGNICIGSTASNGIFLETGAGSASVDCIITNNYCEGNDNYGIRLYGVLTSNISNNTCQENDMDGISVENGCHNNLVSHNFLLANGQKTDNTYAGISIETSNYNLVSGNVCLQGSATNQPKYGISIASTGTPTGNIIEGNNLYDSGETGDVLDDGTSTLSKNNVAIGGGWLD